MEQKTISEIQAQILDLQQKLNDASMPIEDAIRVVTPFFKRPDSFNWRPTRIAALKIVIRFCEETVERENKKNDQRTRNNTTGH